ncbi:hypothetical protein [Thalassotalea maritima]|uniref:hypothetical protein n=1 Tax=Thalassotalea maritima TaxID=3242416 RepID=UPI0035276377
MNLKLLDKNHINTALISATLICLVWLSWCISPHAYGSFNDIAPSRTPAQYNNQYASKYRSNTDTTKANVASNIETYIDTDQYRIDYYLGKNAPFITLRATLWLPINSEQFYRLLTDPKHVMQWLDHVALVWPLTLDEAGRSIVLTRLTGEGPVSSRYMITQSRLIQPTEGEFSLYISDAIEHHLTNYPAIRMSDIDMAWHAKQDSDGVQVSYSGSLKPNGKIPAWLANRAALQSFATSLENLIGEAQKEAKISSKR